MADFVFPTDLMEVCQCLCNSETYFSRCVGYCSFHNAYVTEKQLKTKNCLGKQCNALIKQINHPFWAERELLKLDKKVNKERKIHQIAKKSVQFTKKEESEKKAEPVIIKKRYICIDLEMNELSSKERRAAKGMTGEVIQIGAVMLDENFCCISQFNSLVKPVFSHISEEIIKLTGITDESVSNADTFAIAFYKFYSWAGKDDITTFCWSDSDYKQLFDELYIKAKNHEEYRNFFKTFVDLQSAVGKKLNAEKTLSLDAAMKLCHLKFKGQRHTAFADAFNTARILYKMQTLDNSCIKNLQKLSAYVETSISKRFEVTILKDKDFTTSLTTFVSPELLEKFNYSKEKESKKGEVVKKEKTQLQKILSQKITCYKYGISAKKWLKFSLKMFFTKDMKVAAAFMEGGVG